MGTGGKKGHIPTVPSGPPDKFEYAALKDGFQWNDYQNCCLFQFLREHKTQSLPQYYFLCDIFNAESFQTNSDSITRKST